MAAMRLPSSNPAAAAGVESPTDITSTPSVSRRLPVLPIPTPSAGRSSVSVRLIWIMSLRRKSESASAVFTFMVWMRPSR